MHKLPLFGGAITAEWITLSPSELSLADSKGRTTKMLDDKENTIPRWVSIITVVIDFYFVMVQLQNYLLIAPF